MTTQIGNPLPFFYDRRGRPLDGGKVYIGEAGLDPEANPVDVFFDAGLTITAPSPLDVIGGHLVHNGYPQTVFTEDEQYSIRTRDADGAEVYYVATANAAAETYQPLDTDLTAIADLSTATFGRALLEQSNGANARAHLGVADALPLAGGTMTGSIVRGGAGGHVYMADAAYSNARIFVTDNGASDPRVNPGDIWLEKVA